MNLLAYINGRFLCKKLWKILLLSSSVRIQSQRWVKSRISSPICSEAVPKLWPLQTFMGNLELKVFFFLFNGYCSPIYLASLSLLMRGLFSDFSYLLSSFLAKLVLTFFPISGPINQISFSLKLWVQLFEKSHSSLSF
jgi:hypothetical protein